MALNPEPRIELGQEMLLIGLRQKHAFSALPMEIPKQWAAFKQQYMANQFSPITYGVICSVDQREMEYMCGIEVSSFDSAPSEMGRIKIPKQKYAVFTHTGHISEIGNSWESIMDAHAPALNLEDAHTPSFERYDGRYDPLTGNGVLEIWYPIK